MVLYNLKKMRESLPYNQYIRPEKMVDLSDKYLLDGLVGDQDWLTMLGWEVPSLFYMLPCEYNWQTNPEYRTGRLAHLWQEYRGCGGGAAKILHRNGRL